ncbi:MAG: 1-deoxy-D-xylulose-5-phosphate synthase [Firmicutes bacterium]|nr:1-deoxy-D-xylulose-5-phosphate synthase [candidate division NPL-UPA2 bacterium]MBT9154701.1 1-deoxy-D-xylulose-5-phosphate synthase [candidate division NPL-UPA2 bacterium]MBT9156250.1 1-deoxy-D-xylulose-5-phosphate synthase [candidate division NPL-UPA2 bacterium]
MQAKLEATRDAYGRALLTLGETRPDVVVLDADLSKSTKTAGFAAKYPERFFNIGIAEADLMGTACGLALAGFKPFASTFAIFATGRAYDQVRNSVTYPRLPVVIAATHAGLTVGPDGGSHQSIEDIALMRVLPGMQVWVPADGEEAYQMILAAATVESGPVYVRLGRQPVPRVSPEGYAFVPGTACVLGEAAPVAIIACGVMVDASLQAARLLQEQGIRSQVINISSIKPLDKSLLASVAGRSELIVTVEEHLVAGGLGSACAEALAANKARPPHLMIGVDDRFGQSGEPQELLAAYGLTPERIASRIAQTLAQ